MNPSKACRAKPAGVAAVCAALPSYQGSATGQKKPARERRRVEERNWKKGREGRLPGTSGGRGYAAAGWRFAGRRFADWYFGGRRRCLVALGHPAVEVAP